MEDVLTSLIVSTKASTSNGTGNKKFESVQSRYQRLHVPSSEVLWLVCDQCGEVIHQILYQQHIIRHEVANLVYDMYHNELGEQFRRQEQIDRIQRKEAKEERRRLGLELSSDSSTSSSSSNSSSSDSSRPPSPTPTPELVAKIVPTKKRKKVVAAKNNRNVKKIKLETKDAETAAPSSSISKAKPPKKRESLKKQTSSAAFKRLQQQTKREEEMKRAEFEHQLCLQNLGAGYKQVFVDLRKQRNYFQTQPNAARKRKMPTINSPSAPRRLRRSLRGALRADFEANSASSGGDKMELVALV